MDVASDGLEIAVTALLEQQREEVDLEEEIPELVVELSESPASAASATS